MTNDTRVTRVLDALATVPGWVQPAFLTFVRAYWGWAFLWTGWGKVQHIDQIARWFGEDLHLPLPLLNAWMASSAELVGGALLLLGLGTRWAGAVLAFTMVVAYLTSDFGALQSLWTSAAACEADAVCSPFEEAAPFSFLWAAIIVALWGAGPLSVDRALQRMGFGRFVLERDAQRG